MFIGVREIESVEEYDKAVLVKFFNGEQEGYSKKMYEAMLSEKPQDATSLRDQYILPIVGDLIRVLLDWNVVVKDITAIDSKLIQTLNINTEAADAVHWGKRKDFVTMAELDKVLRSRTPEAK